MSIVDVNLSEIILRKKISFNKQDPLSVNWGESEIIILHQNKLLLFILNIKKNLKKYLIFKNIIFSIYDKTFFQIIFTMLNSFQLNIVKMSEISHFCKITEKKIIWSLWRKHHNWKMGTKYSKKWKLSCHLVTKQSFRHFLH